MEGIGIFSKELKWVGSLILSKVGWSSQDEELGLDVCFQLCAYGLAPLSHLYSPQNGAIKLLLHL